MNIYKISLNDTLTIDHPLSCCIGYFDGLHKGHQALINKANQKAKELNIESGLITFDPDPWVTIKGLSDVKHLINMEGRIKLAEKFGINNIIVLDFDKEMCNLTPLDFLEKVLLRMNLKVLVCGFDFHYGAMGKGNFDTLVHDSKDRFETYMINSIDDHDFKISTTRITNDLINGKIEDVNRLLGYDYFIDGKVIKGNSKGHQIGFATCNIDYDTEIILPKNGVYLGYIKVLGKTYKAMINIGHNPTFNYVNHRSLEVHIIDFNENIYGEKVEVIFKSFKRDEIKFASIDDLIKQLTLDAESAKEQKDYE